ncbi:Gfo/Idh/MocA family protein [Breznakiella homolactica]|uniref:Gfo/Idh/MocA family oxidoreductase n=1 Tax=Breznakiella homolactica TaxID=2798577 RepID=A0A7T8B9C8_9SPIR|nr:Gfo/Idh/MocA family oxidoreductase [Breznakiella homolactica]QQO08196.1 Gfo/Idh/MocA family oxidoreductase [Breznakiella homolactica]
MEPIKVLILGAGNRGGYAYAGYAKMNPKMMKVVSVADPNEAKRKRIQEEHGIPDSLAFASWEDALINPPELDAVIIATQDKMHAGPLAKAMALNLNILCEKPIVPTLDECRQIEKDAADFTKVFMIAHVLKYTSFFSKVKELLDAGKIGKLIGIDLIESVGHIHISHSFVRGNWRNLAESSPMILAKSCHDMDMLHWLAAADCESVSSYGALNYFKAENAPAGAPRRCLDGCPHMIGCPYHVSKIYLTDNIGWPTNVITTDLSMEGRVKALETGPYGRCVFHCDNDVVDHQTVAMKFTNGVTANFTMSGFTYKTHRNVTLFGTAGEMTGDMEEGTVTIKDFSSRNIETIDLAKPVGGHSGGDVNFLTDFVMMVRDKSGAGRTSVKDSFESHYMAFAAESSRLSGGKTLSLGEFKKSGK